MSDHVRVLMTHPHDGHAPNETCLDCQAAGRVRSKAQQAAEERYPLNGDATNIAIRATLQTGYVAGRLDALPENPDPAVIEAMKKALFLDHGTDQAGETAPEIAKACERMARAAYAALRGAMQ